MSSNTTIEIPQLSLKILKTLVNQPGWAKTPKDLYIAGKIDADGKLETAEVDPKATEEIAKAWAETPVKLELMGKEVDALKRCLTHNIAEGKLGATKYIYRMVDAFGLSE